MSGSIVITGASSGIGKALAFEMARRGYRVGLAARRMEVLESIQAQIMTQKPDAAVAVQSLDVTDDKAVPPVLENFAESLNGLDIVVANAGIGLGERIGRHEFEKHRRTIEVNLIGAMATADAAAAYFLENGGGHIVGLSSIAAFRGMPKSAAYCASKAGFAVYLEALRAEMLRKHISVTVLYPGYIDTPLNDMLKNRPFLISAEKGAAIIADLIRKKVKSAAVPAYPWALVGPLLKILPTKAVAKM